MNFLHTADWHLGQTFYQYDRYTEHQTFLTNLLKIIKEQHTDVLLISGDIFDTANPPVTSVRQFYEFLHQATQQFPHLQIIAIAGNHDSPVRLEMPQPLLEETRVHLIGYVKRNADKQIDYPSLIIPLYSDNEITAYCLAVPFLRLGDTPKPNDTALAYTEGITTFYREITNEALKIANEKPLIAMGHLHASGAEISDDDTAERPIIGGIECVNANSFPPELSYIALGHIHKAQTVGNQPHIRYAGSPIPLSFSEKHYQHQVISFSLKNGKITDITPIKLPLHTQLVSIPESHQPAEEVLNALTTFDDNLQLPAPYLEVKVLLTEPTPDLKYRIAETLTHKHLRLARIDVRYSQQKNAAQAPLQKELTLHELQPFEVLQRVYENKYHAPLPDYYQPLFEEAMLSLDVSR